MKRGLALVAVALLAACSSGGSSSSSASSPRPAATNSTDFPLYDGSTIVTSREWTQAVSGSAAAGARGIYRQGAGTYNGHEVVAHTNAAMPQLRAWLDGLEKHPPNGYEPAATGSAVDEARNRAQAAGLDFDVFEKTVDGKRRGVVVVAIDPQLLQQKAGPMLGFISKYKMLPQSLRDPIDAQAKARTGFSITEALSPDTPLGAALGALDDLRSSGDRGLVVIDAAKQ